MLWVLLSISSAVAIATAIAIEKKLLLGNLNLYILGGFKFVFAGLILFIFSSAQGLPAPSTGFYSAVFITVVLNIVANIIIFKILKSSDMSLTTPMLAFSPVFLIATSFFILGELPSFLGVVGILSIVCGSFILHRNHVGGNEKWSNTFSRMRKSPGALMALFVAFIFSISSNFDKIATIASTPFFASAVIDLIIGTCFFVLAYFMTPRKEMRMPHMGWLILIGGLIAFEMWAMNTAFTMQIVPYVISVKRFSILLAVLYGYFLFKEKNVRPRLIATAIMLLGIILIASQS